MKYVLVTLIILMNANTAFAKENEILLKCTSKLANKTISEVKHIEQGNYYTLDVTFIGHKPTEEIQDSIMRNCLNETLGRDNEKEILVNSWYRSKFKSNPHNDEMLFPYGIKRTLYYSPKSRSIDFYTPKMK